MKKIFTLTASALMAMASWAGVITLDLNANINPASLEFNENGVWTQCYNDVDYTWLEFGDENGEFLISHLIDGEGASWGGMYWDGFIPAIGGDQTDYSDPTTGASWYSMFGGCMAGGGCVIGADGKVSADATKPYLVAFYSSWAAEGPSCQVMFTNKDGNMAFTPAGVYVCNHPWPYYDCLHGEGSARAFAEGDYFELTAVGVAADGTQTSTATDKGNYGMNTAAYFCMDKFQVKGLATAVENVNADKQVAGVQYVNISGMTSDKPFQGLNIVVTTYSDGTTSTAKVVK